MRFPRSWAVLACIVGGALAFLAVTQVWLVASDIAALPGTEVTSTGQDAAGAVTAMAMVAIASGIALSIAGRIAQFIIAVLIAASSLLLAASTIAVIADPVAYAAPKVAERSGLTEPAGTVILTWAPWLSLAAAVILLLCAVGVLIFGRSWITSRKYDAPTATTGSEKPADSRQEPAERPEAVTTRVENQHLSAEQRARGRVAEIDTWDELSQGNDPT